MSTQSNHVWSRTAPPSDVASFTTLQPRQGSGQSLDVPSLLSKQLALPGLDLVAQVPRLLHDPAILDYKILVLTIEAVAHVQEVSMRSFGARGHSGFPLKKFRTSGRRRPAQAYVKRLVKT
ncbi:hypothetical protein cyc_02278 [Cyclospora cayetanensis]|uniref:Uncharacterized protein n=1 Tax=Cyclospora cayetanensis TaxID=88456 RepID=A0A1D3D4N8_9EIME|nr:hypothetical protein cyc_02278 [Cyclospora cayetanensis]